MQNSFYDRLMQIMSFLEINSLRGFAKKIDISFPKLQSYQRGSLPGLDVLNNILSSLPDISPEWLLTGKGDMLRNKYPPLLPEDQKTLQEICESIRKENLRLKEKLEEKDKQLGELIKTNLLLLEREKEDCDSPQEKKKRCSSAG